MSELAKWDSFYVIVGSAAGALIGLQFVVITLIAERPPAGAAKAGVCGSKPHTNRNSRTGCFMLCCLWPRTQYSRLSSFAAPSHTREALFGVGGAALLLLFTLALLLEAVPRRK